MALCIVAATVFGALSLFSARYRPLAKESFRCAFRMITFRKCDVQLKERLRAGVTGRLMDHSPRLASFVYHNFKLLSWMFVILFFTSLIYTGYSIYNLAMHGTCDPQQPNACIFKPEAPECSQPSCGPDSSCGIGLNWERVE